MASNDPPLSPSPSSEASTIPPPAQSPPNSSLGSITAMEEWREYATAESPTLGPEPNIIISHDGDDAIARHEYLLHLHHNHEHTHPINHDNNQELPTLHNESENGFDKQDSPRYTSKMTPRIRSISSPTIPQSYSLPSFPRKAKSCYAFEEACESHWDYGPSAIAEEEAALEYAAELAAAKAASKKRKRSSSVTSVAGGAEAEAEAETGTGVDWGAAFGEEEEEIEEEDDHCLSGVCLPKSQFFQTSVICSNTMTRDGLGMIKEQR
ncbi:hypothetical protein BGZ58_005068 [Dissophora ornata]|nr:hypothetical protein BGZ58_005068 [Dissophora ornata]